MAFKYEQAVPWGRSFDEYRRMFGLTDEDLSRTILGCADGPASFNAEMSKQGHRVVSCDPLYQFSTDQISQRIDATYENVINQTRRNQEKFVWDLIPSLDDLGRVRLAAMHDFLGDYERGKAGGRYVPAQLPDLPFANLSFDLVLCSHFLFLYSDSFPLVFHQQAVDELCRVAREVRIFPLLTYNGDPCPFVTPIMSYLKEAGRLASIEKVPYEFQRGGNMMMRILSRNGGKPRCGIETLRHRSASVHSRLRLAARESGDPRKTEGRAAWSGESVSFCTDGLAAIYLICSTALNLRDLRPERHPNAIPR